MLIFQGVLWKMLLLSGFVDVLKFWGGELTTWPPQTHQMVNARTILRASRLNEALFRRIHRMHWKLALGFLQEMGTIESRKGSSMLKGLSYMTHRYLSTDSKDRNWDTSPKMFKVKLIVESSKQIIQHLRSSTAPRRLGSIRVECYQPWRLQTTKQWCQVVIYISMKQCFQKVYLCLQSQ